MQVPCECPQSKSFSSFLKLFLLVFVFLIPFFSQPKNAVSAIAICVCGDGVCQPDRGELTTCAYPSDGGSPAGDCFGKGDCAMRSCSAIPDGCCPALVTGGPKCQGVLMGQPDFDPDCYAACSPHTCPNGLIDQPGENCEIDPVSKKEVFAAGITCKAGSCYSMGPNACHCCGDGQIDRPEEECDPRSLNQQQCAAKGPKAVCTENCVCAACGDGKVDPGEDCDGPGTACTKGGQPGVCNEQCGCIPLCGNGKVDPGETCDEGPLNGTPGHCRTDCHICGDGMKNGSEMCDKADPNTPPLGCAVGEKCDNNCLCVALPPAPKCGDNKVNLPNETCDGTDLGMCAAVGSCRAAGATDECSCCGDGKKQASEKCDNGAMNSPNPTDLSGACRAGSCTSCGDGEIQAAGGEQCEKDADCGDPSKICQGCLCVPKPVKCGDGFIDMPSETCDAPALGVCPAGSCRAPGATDQCSCCGDGKKQGSEKCDSGAANSPNPKDLSGVCRAGSCTSCGDGEVQAAAGEQCEKDTDCGDPSKVCQGCLCVPKAVKCGDNFIDMPSETCDGTSLGICPAGSCRIPGATDQCSCCGDGKKQGSEKCDNGAANSANPKDLSGACRAGTCTSCGDGEVQMGAGEMCEKDADCGDPSKVCQGCLCVPKAAKCGDGFIDMPSETCDAPAVGVCPAGSCRAPGATDQCSCCGDGKKQASEKCDNGVMNSGNPKDLSGACRAGTCTSCGDGEVQMGSGEQCEKDADCGDINKVCQGCLCVPKPVKCGDNIIDKPAETCDGTSLGICSAGSCRAPGATDQCSCCGDGTKQGSEKCDSGAANSPNPHDLTGACRAGTCTSCGDGDIEIAAGEQCEKDADCKDPDKTCKGCLCVKNPPPTPKCGNGLYEPANGETCDTPQAGVCGTNKCRTAAEASPCSCCGDRNVDKLAGEECDDGADNGKPASNCTAACKIKPPPAPQCGNVTIEGTETCDGTARGTKTIDGKVIKIVCQQDCRDKSGSNACSCCGDLQVDKPSEDCDPPNGVTCDNNCKTITGQTPPPPPPPAQNPPAEPVLCGLEGAGGCGSDLSKELPNPCVASVLDPSIWQTMSPLTLIQWLSSLLVPGALFGIMRIKKIRK